MGRVRLVVVLVVGAAAVVVLGSGRRSSCIGGLAIVLVVGIGWGVVEGSRSLRRRSSSRTVVEVGLRSRCVSRRLRCCCSTREVVGVVAGVVEGGGGYCMVLVVSGTSPSSCWSGRRRNGGSRSRRSRSSRLSRKGSIINRSSRGFRGRLSRRRRRIRMSRTRRGSSSYARICVCTHVGARAHEKESTTHGHMPKRVPPHGSGGELQKTGLRGRTALPASAAPGCFGGIL